MIQKIDPKGNINGKEYHLETPSLMTEIGVRSGGWIDGISIKDDQGASASAGGSGGGAATFKLEPGEFLTSITGYYGHHIGQFTLKTNRGKTAIYGAGHGGNMAHSFELNAGEGMAIIGFFGNADNYLNSIGAYVAEIPSMNMDMPSW